MKQVIILRKDLNMRKGKMIAQGAHASLEAYSNAGLKEAKVWNETGHKKIVVGVENDTELMAIYWKATNANLPASLILDSGLTEFKSPTYTAVAIGPADDAEIDKITGELKLL